MTNSPHALARSRFLAVDGTLTGQDLTTAILLRHPEQANRIDRRAATDSNPNPADPETRQPGLLTRLTTMPDSTRPRRSAQVSDLSGSGAGGHNG